MIGLIDYGCGNLGSLGHALETLGRPFKRVGSAADMAGCERLILPGVGHYGHAMAELRRRGLEQPLRDWQGPLLGICLGMQVLFEGSDEAPDVPGLGFLAGRFRRFPEEGLKVPHMGWSPMSLLGRTRPVYFVHSYRLPAWEGPQADLGWAGHGGPFVAAFRCGRLGGFQFHPEKSGEEGLALLEEALRWS